MRSVAILISGSRNASFYSQIAAISLAVSRLPWQRWRPAIYAYLGGEEDERNDDEWRHWRPHLRNVQIVEVSTESFSRKNNWAQADASVELAPANADVLMSLDADTLPVAGFEDVLDRVAEKDHVAGVIAHYSPSHGTAARFDWAGIAEGLIGKPLTFPHAYSLVEPDADDDCRLTPFYINGGVIFYGRGCFDRFAPLYLQLRPHVAARLVDDAFSGQIATALAVTEAGLSTWALPMRYNFPNDPIAAHLYPDEAAQVVIHHYLRTGQFNRHSLFATRHAFEQFLSLALEGPNAAFQGAVRRVLTSHYPFA